MMRLMGYLDKIQSDNSGPKREEGWHFFGVFPWSKGRRGRTNLFAKIMRVLLFPAFFIVIGTEIAHGLNGWKAPLLLIIPAAVVVVAYLIWIARESFQEAILLIGPNGRHRDTRSDDKKA